MPCLSAAIVDHYRPLLARLDSVDYGISAAQQTNRGLATASAVLSYIGRPFTTLRDGAWVTVHGWQDLHAETYPELGRRLFGNCDIPDLELFPARYPGLKTVRFGAGHEVALLHLGTWALSGLVRARLLPPLDRFSERLLGASALFDRFGTSRSGLHMFLTGADAEGREKTIRFFLIARSGDGPNIPCMPAILLARRLARGGTIAAGARPCLDLITLDEYLAALADLDVSVMVDEDLELGTDTVIGAWLSQFEDSGWINDHYCPRLAPRHFPGATTRPSPPSTIRSPCSCSTVSACSARPAPPS